VLGNASILQFVFVTQNQVMNSLSGAGVKPLRSPWPQFLSLQLLGCELPFQITGCVVEQPIRNNVPAVMMSAMDFFMVWFFNTE
jgi:hypothetical protein